MKKTSVFLFTAALYAALPAVLAAPRAKHHASGHAAHVSLAHAKGSFGSISAGSSAVRHALSASNLKAAAKLEGKQGSFVGKVVSVYIPSNKSVVLLDFAKPYYKAISAALKPAYYSQFPDMRSLLGKTVLLTGRLSLYNKKQLEIVLQRPSQIRVVQKQPSRHI